MKTHTFFLSNKALAIVAVSLTTTGAFVFILGLFIGIAVQPPTPGPGSIAGAERQTVAGGGSAAPGWAAATSTTRAPAGWPFVATDTLPTPEPAKPVDTTGAKRVTPATKASIIGVAFNPDRTEPGELDDLEPITEPDTIRYAVQVGQFRIERNARLLAARLIEAGYRATVTERTEEGRLLHVVRVGRYIGLVSAEAAARTIGDTERIVVAVLPIGGR